MAVTAPHPFMTAKWNQTAKCIDETIETETAHLVSPNKENQIVVQRG